MKPNNDQPHRYTGQTFEASGKAWTVQGLDQERPGRMFVLREGKDERPQSWPITVVEGYVLRTAAARKSE